MFVNAHTANMRAVSNEADRAHTEWRKADTEAREAERRLQAAWIAHDKGGEPPTDEMWSDVYRLHSVARDKLKAAVAALSVQPPKRGTGQNCDSEG